MLSTGGAIFVGSGFDFCFDFDFESDLSLDLDPMARARNGVGVDGGAVDWYSVAGEAAVKGRRFAHGISMPRNCA